MKLPLSWLHHHLETSATTDVLIDTLNGLGLEVEGVKPSRIDLSSFSAALIVRTDPHPNADTLKICQVRTADGEKQIVCGAPNAKEDLITAYAPVGTLIPATGKTLKQATIRGMASDGMLCSERELTLGSHADGIIELDPSLEVGTPLNTLYTSDTVFDLAVAPNRPDCLGIRGIARDLAAAGVGTLRTHDLERLSQTSPKGFGDPSSLSWIVHDDENACLAVSGCLIEGVDNTTPSPAWLQDFLQSAGLRPISLLVDLSNYLTLDAARPVHIYDADKIDGSHLHMRRAHAEEVLTALNGEHYALTTHDTVIADQSSVQGLAGVIGGLHSGVQSNTRRIFLEVALFKPANIRATSMHHRLKTDASHRFERGVDRSSHHWGITALTNLIVRHAGGTIAGTSFVHPPADPQPHVVLHLSDIKRIGGTSIPSEQVQDILNDLGFKPILTRGLPDSPDDVMVSCTPPPWRFDLQTSNCLIEEILRCAGYHRVPTISLPQSHPPISRNILPDGFRQRQALSLALSQHGLRQTLLWPFVSKNDRQTFATNERDSSPGLRIVDPIDSARDRLASSPLSGLVEAVERNINRQHASIHLFTVGARYTAEGDQTDIIAGIRSGLMQERSPHTPTTPRMVDIFDAKKDTIVGLSALGMEIKGLQLHPQVEGSARYHPGRCGSWQQGKKVLAVFGELHPSLLKKSHITTPTVAFEIFVDAITLPKRWRVGVSKKRPGFSPQPLPPIERDFSFVIPKSLATENLVRALSATKIGKITSTPLSITQCQVFDIHHLSSTEDSSEDSLIAVGICITIQPMGDRSPTSDELEMVSQSLIRIAHAQFGATLRQ